MSHNNVPDRYFPHERLAAYGYALEVLKLVASRREKLRGLPGGLAAQLERAVVGAISNLCAGASAQGAEGRRHFKISYSEAGEAGGCLDAAWVLGAFNDEEYQTLRSLLHRLCACLYGLIH